MTLSNNLIGRTLACDARIEIFLTPASANARRRSPTLDSSQIDARDAHDARDATLAPASYCEPGFSLVPSRSTHKGKERLVDIETKLGPKTSYPVLVG